MNKKFKYLTFTIILILTFTSFSSALPKRKVNFIKTNNQTHLCSILNKSDKNYIQAEKELKKYFKDEDFKNYSCTSCNGKVSLSFNPKDMLELSKNKKPYTIYYAEIKDMKVHEIRANYVFKPKEKILSPEGKNLKIYTEKSKSLLTGAAVKSPAYVKSFIPIDIQKTYSNKKKTPSSSVSSVFKAEDKYYIVMLSQNGASLEMVKEINDIKSLDKYISDNIYKNL